MLFGVLISGDVVTNEGVSVEGMCTVGEEESEVDIETEDTIEFETFTGALLG